MNTRGYILSYLKPYQYVLTIAETGSISQAAEQLDVAQSSLSRYLIKVEEELGIKLFDRSTVPIRITEAGKKYIKAGRTIINIERQLNKQIDQLNQTENISIRIGISPSRTSYLLPGILKEFRKTSSSKIVIEERGINELNMMLTRGDIDLNFSYADETTSEFTSIELFEDQMLFAYSDTYSFSNDYDYLKKYPVIGLPKGTRTGDLLYSIVGDKKNEFEISCASVESALAIVKEGLGITIVPSYIARFGSFNDIKFKPINEMLNVDLKSSTFCLFHRKNQFLTQTESEFIDSTVKVISKIGNNKY